MNSTWLRRGLLVLAAVLAVGALAALLLPGDRSELQTQEDPTPQTQAQAQAPQQQAPQQQAQEPQTQEQEPPQEDTPMYEMGIWEGKVAVFVPGTDHPMRITEMPVTSLPLPDQQALEKRIPVYDAQALASFLEDYGS